MRIDAETISSHLRNAGFSEETIDELTQCVIVKNELDDFIEDNKKNN